MAKSAFGVEHSDEISKGLHSIGSTTGLLRAYKPSGLQIAEKAGQDAARKTLKNSPSNRRADVPKLGKPSTGYQDSIKLANKSKSSKKPSSLKRKAQLAGIAAGGSAAGTTGVYAIDRKVSKAVTYDKKQGKKLARSGAQIGAGLGGAIGAGSAIGPAMVLKKPGLVPLGAAGGAVKGGVLGTGVGGALGFKKKKKLSKALMPMADKKQMPKPMMNSAPNAAAIKGGPNNPIKKPMPKQMMSKGFTLNRKEAKKDALNVGATGAAAGAGLGALSQEPFYRRKGGKMVPVGKFPVKAASKGALAVGVIGASSGVAANLGYKRKKKS
jgi:hypothetical protein